MFFRRTGIILDLVLGWRGSRLGRGAEWCGRGMEVILGLAGGTVRSRIGQYGHGGVCDTHGDYAAVTACPQVANQGFGYACSYTSAPPAAVGVTTSADVFDRRFRLPMVQQGSFGVEREFWRGVTGSATYLLNVDRQLPSSVDINVAPSTGTGVFQLVGRTGLAGVRDGETFAVPVYTQRVSGSFGPVTDIVSDVGATYHALVLEGRRRGGRSLEFRANWITGRRRLITGRAAGRFRGRMRSSIRSILGMTRGFRL